MASTRPLFVILVLVYATHGDQSTSSKHEKFQTQDNGSPPQLLLNEVSYQSINIPHRFSSRITKESKYYKKSVVPELQVGCGEGSLEIRAKALSNAEKIKKKSRKLRRKRAVEEIKRTRRGYYPWPEQTMQIPPFHSIRVWRPPTYQISRPYYIPTWGSSGRIPMYFPPQPLLLNPGYPDDNPPKGYMPPKSGYLPPDRHTTPSPLEVSTMELPSRAGDGSNNSNNDEDDPPIWDFVDSSDSVRAPLPSFSRSTTTQPIPTRRTRPPGQRTSTFPPLVHSVESSMGNVLSPHTQSRPRSISTTTTTVSPRQSSTQNKQSEGPSRCVWAIVSCCSPASGDVSYSCFEQMGCAGAFWDSSPCNNDFARAAIASAMNYYNKK